MVWEDIPLFRAFRAFGASRIALKVDRTSVGAKIGKILEARCFRGLADDEKTDDETNSHILEVCVRCRRDVGTLPALFVTIRGRFRYL